MRIRYTREALLDLQRLRAFIAEHDPQAAARVAADLVQRIEALAAHPRVGRPVDQAPAPDVLRDLITPHHVIRYLLHDDTLHILRLWHQRENPPGDT